jgi:hypothetical protein
MVYGQLTELDNGRVNLPIKPGTVYTDGFLGQVTEYKRMLGTEDVSFNEDTGKITTGLSLQEAQDIFDSQSELDSREQAIDALVEELGI